MIKTDEQVAAEATSDETARLLNDTAKLAKQRGAKAAVIIFVEADGKTSRAVWGDTDASMESVTDWIDAFLNKVKRRAN